jgi:bifunctional non-homologous end joining protein LigD
LRDGSQWVYEIKLDGYRAIAVKSGNRVRLFSRRQKSFNQQYPYIVDALVDLPDGTVIDGEIVALNDSARPQFNLLQNYRSEARRIPYFVFDLLCYNNLDATTLSLVQRRELLRTLKFQSPRIQLLHYFETSAANMVAAAKEQGLAGVIAKQGVHGNGCSDFEEAAEERGPSHASSRTSCGHAGRENHRTRTPCHFL